MDTTLASQFPNDPVFVGSWWSDDENPVYPQGQKPKRLLICPEDVHQPYLLRGHSYLFKEAEGRRTQQLWAEVIAYQLGREAGVDVPPAFVAYDEKRGVPGVLIEFFFGFASPARPERFVHAIDAMQAVRMPVNQKRGSLRDNIKLSRLYQTPNALGWWARTIAFDSLIGNTDRHSENWGFLRQTSEPHDPRFRLAPVFDNGTSLAYEIPNEGLDNLAGAGSIERYVMRGSHHYDWAPGDSPLRPHAALCQRMLKVYPTAAAPMRPVAQLSDAAIQDTLQWCTKFEIGPQFTADRAVIIERLLKARRTTISSAIGD